MNFAIPTTGVGCGSSRDGAPEASASGQLFEQLDFLGQDIAHNLAEILAVLLCDALQALLQPAVKVNREPQARTLPVELAPLPFRKVVMCFHRSSPRYCAVSPTVCPPGGDQTHLCARLAASRFIFAKRMANDQQHPGSIYAEGHPTLRFLAVRSVEYRHRVWIEKQCRGPLEGYLMFPVSHSNRCSNRRSIRRLSHQVELSHEAHISSNERPAWHAAQPFCVSAPGSTARSIWRIKYAGWRTNCVEFCGSTTFSLVNDKNL